MTPPGSVRPALEGKPRPKRLAEAVAKGDNAEGDRPAKKRKVTARERMLARKEQRERINDNEVARVPIYDERLGYTNVTSWWADGSPGPPIYIFPEGKWPPALIAETR